MPFWGQRAHTYQSPLNSIEFRQREVEISRVSTLGSKAARQKYHAATVPGRRLQLEPRPSWTSADPHQHWSLRPIFLSPITQTVPRTVFDD